MKHIFIRENGVKSPFHPFWQPQSLVGWIGRLMAFLAALSVLLFLLSLVEQRQTYYNPEPTPPIPKPAPIDTLIDTPQWPDTLGEKVNWPVPVPNPAPGLPSDSSLVIPPYGEGMITPAPGGKYIIADRLNVILDPKASDKTINKFAREFKALYPSDDYSIVYYNTLTKVLQLRVPPADRDRMINELPGQIPDIMFKVFKEELFGPVGNAVPDDPAFSDSKAFWYMDMIQAFDAWEITTGDPDVTVAIVDSYFELSHDELADKWIYPLSLENGTTDVSPVDGCPMDYACHGSHVASIAVGRANNGSGACGIAPGCRFIPVSLGTQLTSMKILEGILYAVYKGADVINLSMGSAFSEEVSKIPVEIQQEIIESTFLVEEEVWDFVFDLADKYNCIIVWSGGNDDVLAGLDDSKRNDKTIRVSAVGKRMKKSSFSNFGYREAADRLSYSTISAPGEDIFGAVVYNSYEFWDGTSMAAPIVTVAVALMKSVYKGLTAQEAIAILQETGLPLNDPSIGNLLQIRDALDKVKESMLKYDDLMEDHRRLIGLWEATEQLDVLVGGEYTEQKIHLFMEFDDTESGTLILEESPSGLVFKAPLSVTFSEDSLIIRQQGRAKNESTDISYLQYDFSCIPDEEGYLWCRAKLSDSHEKGPSFNLRKVN